MFCMCVVPLCNLLTSICDFVSRDGIVQRAYSSKAGQRYPTDKSLMLPVILNQFSRQQICTLNSVLNKPMNFFSFAPLLHTFYCDCMGKVRGDTKIHLLQRHR